MLAVLAYAKGTAEPYLIPDDARQYVFWMHRFVDRDLFTDDLIADYFQSVSPTGFVWLYRGAAFLGLSPLLFNQLLPAILFVLTAALTFLTCFELCAMPAAGFAASLLLAQSVGFTSAVASGTPKAFVYGLTLLFLYGWLRRSCGLSWLAIVLQGLLQPQTVLISSGLLVLGLIDRQEGRWRLNSDRALWILTLGGLAISTAVILQYALSSSGFGPTLTAAEAHTMPEFYAGGRNKFFRPDPWDFLLHGRSGLRLDAAFTPVTNLLALALPALLRAPKRFPLAASVRPGISILPKLALTSAFWFTAAHMLLFKLHLPNRYTGRYLLILFVLATGITVVILIDALLQGAIQGLTQPAGRVNQLWGWIPAALKAAAAAALASVLILYPLTFPGFPKTSLAQGTQPDLYRFFESQPKDSLIASLSAETSNLPNFARRSVLVSPEVTIPYHVGYYRAIQQRVRDLLVAQYSPDPGDLRAVITRYGITHWLLQADAFNLWTLNGNRWLQQYQPEAGNASSVLATGQRPVLLNLGDRCAVFASADYQVLDAQCLLAAIDPA
ncbi:MAG: hypothetical protein F6J95_028115 [Leptolyngbya sp. SIO1E4]|nr:hypothetical protein [Leptolyngbya sp. SIO1E4]